MARIPRKYIKFSSESYYHIISHLADELPYLRPHEKNFLLSLLHKLSKIFHVGIISYAFMGNHFHLLIKTFDNNYFSEKEAIDRAFALYPKNVVLSHSETYWKAKLTDISFFVKELKQRFSQWYNKLHQRKGHVWRGRFKSIIVESQKGLIAASSYIDLNPTRAGAARTLTSYNWNSYTARKANLGKWLLSIKETLGLDLREYGELLEQLSQIKIGRKAILYKTQPSLYRYILQYTAKGIVFGTVNFVEKFLKTIPIKRRKKVKFSGMILA